MFCVEREMEGDYCKQTNKQTMGSCEFYPVHTTNAFIAGCVVLVGVVTTSDESSLSVASSIVQPCAICLLVRGSNRLHLSSVGLEKRKSAFKCEQKPVSIISHRKRAASFVQ